MCPLYDNPSWKWKQCLWWNRDQKEDGFEQFYVCKTIWCFKRHDNKQILFLYSIHWFDQRMFYYLEIFQEIGDKQNRKQFEFILVHFFFV